ncbi:tryptophan-rich sensory protein [Microbacterium sp. W1N]|uniref:tryptophan-rich sensory protein n=1 Tax=Microbacterium festucae TaxID=2977531 RepID=UPI0021BED029|nr:tryptophan-rich sensory protein [Microbacterium festucae]MCT9819148.1 tryptophan-rich sensory protein [Microbacterium festucae]
MTTPTTTTTTTGSASGTPRDIIRQVAVISAVVFMIIAAMVGTGLFGGTNVRELQGGALDADATVLAPGTSAFSIWTVIYVLMVGYAVWQALPSQRGRARQRRAGWWVALTAVLNGGWLLAAQFTTLPLTVIAIVVLLIALGLTLRVLSLSRTESFAERLLLDGMVGLHLGWVTLATVANVTAWLAAEVVPSMDAASQTIWGVIVLVVVAGIGVLVAIGTRGERIAPPLAMAWGLVWIGIARLATEPYAPAVAVAAFVAAVIVLAAPFVVAAARRRRHAH